MTEAARIEPAGQPHAAVLAALQTQCFDDVWSQSSIEEIMASPGTFALLAIHGESMPIGFALARLVGDEAELLSLGVVAEQRRKGVARMLLARVIERAIASGALALFLEVAESNDAARLLYSARGFTAVGRRPDYYRRPNAVPVAALTLRLSLSRS
jgi:[ribosomal protein S18]-alanine N-acetyltransferase